MKVGALKDKLRGIKKDSKKDSGDDSELSIKSDQAEIVKVHENVSNSLSMSVAIDDSQEVVPEPT
jgi:hypothetical protein